MPLPDLDTRAGTHFTFRNFVECGETWSRLSAAGLTTPGFNVPERPETYAAIVRLCQIVLDPVVEQFGPVEFTYGFASRELTRNINARISPRLDQHAGHELNRRGIAICERLGFAVDLGVPQAGSSVVARWIVEETNFDRLYFYGDDRPVHVSCSAEPHGQIVLMMSGPSGRLIPRVVPRDRFVGFG